MTATPTPPGPPANGNGKLRPNSAPRRDARQMEEISDAALVRQAQAGNAAGLDLLLRRHWNGLLARVRRQCGGCHLAEDLCQETCLKAIARLGTLRHPEAIQMWFRQFLLYEEQHCRRNNCRNICTPTPRTGTYLIEDESVAPAGHFAEDWEHLWSLLWRQADRNNGRQTRVAAFMLDYYTRHERFPSVRAIARETCMSIPTARHGRRAALLTWQRVLRTFGHTPDFVEAAPHR